MNKEGKAAYKVTFAQVAISGNSLNQNNSFRSTWGGNLWNNPETVWHSWIILCIFLIATALEICWRYF